MPKANYLYSVSGDSTEQLLPIDAKADTPNSEEDRYRVALDELVSVFNDDTIESEAKIEHMLEIGCQYLSMPSALVYADMGEVLEVRHLSSTLPDISIGTTIPLDNTFCSVVLDTGEAVALQNIQDSEFDSRLNDVVLNLKSYIGTQVNTGNGPFGVLSFINHDLRSAPFDAKDTRIANTIATWVGMIIGASEQLEFQAQQNDYYRSLFGSVPSMMMLCNDDGLILSASDLLSHTIGLPTSKLPGQNCQQFFKVSDTGSLKQALLAGNVHHLPLTLEKTNEQTLEVELNSCIKTIGSMQGVRMIVLNDVSERNIAMREVKAQVKQLALANQSLNQFAVIASHDLQEPLRKIQQFSHFLGEDLEDVMTNDGQHHLSVIDKSAKHMSTLIQDLLRFSSAAKEDLIVSDVDINLVINDVCDQLELRIAENNAKIIKSKMPTVQGDSGMIRQLFANLIGNSLKYRDSSRDPVIEISCISNNDRLLINVCDNGIGFDQKLVSRAFEPFSRLHTNKEYTGNGIGLSICSTVCEKHGWSLSAKSQPGEGTVFSILLF